MEIDTCIPRLNVLIMAIVHSGNAIVMVVFLNIFFRNPNCRLPASLVVDYHFAHRVEE